MAYRATTSLSLLLSVVGVSSKAVTMNTTASTPSALSGITCSDIEHTSIAKDCLQQGHAGGSVGFMECVCTELGIEDGCPSGCSYRSQSHQETPSISINSMQTESRHIDGDPEIPAMVTVPLTNNKRHAHDTAAHGKGTVEIGDLPVPHANSKTPSQQRRRRKRSHQQPSPEPAQDGMSTSRKIIGAIAVGVLVMVV